RAGSLREALVHGRAAERGRRPPRAHAGPRRALPVRARRAAPGPDHGLDPVRRLPRPERPRLPPRLSAFRPRPAVRPLPLRPPPRGERFRFVFAVQRQGRTTFWSLFGDFRDQNVLVFHLDYALSDLARLFVRSRYGFRRVADAPDGTARYLVERRFEPLVGLRVHVR